jgi:hypothetical protein
MVSDSGFLGLDGFVVFRRIGFRLFRVYWTLVFTSKKKEEVDRYWILPLTFGIWFFRELDKFLGRLDIGQIDAISINFWHKSMYALLNRIEQNCSIF